MEAVQRVARTLRGWYVYWKGGAGGEIMACNIVKKTLMAYVFQNLRDEDGDDEQ